MTRPRRPPIIPMDAPEGYGPDIAGAPGFALDDHARGVCIGVAAAKVSLLGGAALYRVLIECGMDTGDHVIVALDAEDVQAIVSLQAECDKRERAERRLDA